MAFINNGKKNGLFDQKNCNHSDILGSFFGSSCVPGAFDSVHNAQAPNNLCTLCPHTRVGDGASVELSKRELPPADPVPLGKHWVKALLFDLVWFGFIQFEFIFCPKQHMK